MTKFIVNYFLFILLFFTLSSLSEAPFQDNPSQTDKFKPSDILPTIDSLYNIQKEDSFELVEHPDFKNTIKEDRYSILALDLKHATHYYSYRTFSFLRYKDSLHAKRVFEELTGYYKEVFIKEYNWDKIEKLKTKEGIELVYTVFPKGGVTYIRKDNYLIEHSRACNYDHTIQNPKEDFLIDRLYPNGKPGTPYFIRTCCGCPRDIEEELR